MKAGRIKGVAKELVALTALKLNENRVKLVQKTYQNSGFCGLSTQY
jgi:hypothetical protein